MEGIAALGLDTSQLLVEVGIDPKDLDDPDARISRAKAARVWQEAARRSGDPDMGLHVAERIQPRAFHVVLYLAMSSRTLREGIGRILRYQRLFGTASRLALEERQSDGFIRLEFGTDEIPLTRHQAEQIAVQLLKYCRWITEEEFDFLEVHFDHPAPDDTSEHSRIFRCPVYFDAEVAGLLLSGRDLDRPSMHADERLARAHEQFAAESLRELGLPAFAREVEASLIPVLEMGQLDLRSAAVRLRMSPRTLQRRLTEEGTSYREVVDRLRQRVTMRHLSRNGPPIDEVAYLAGFSDSSAFYRAFKRWTGKTPSEYRARSAAG